MEQSTSSALSFCRRMLKRVKNTEHETQWKKLQGMLEAKSLSDVQRKKIERFISKTKTKYLKPTESAEKANTDSATKSVVRISETDTFTLPANALGDKDGQNRLTAEENSAEKVTPVSTPASANDALKVDPASVATSSKAQSESLKGADCAKLLQTAKEPSLEPAFKANLSLLVEEKSTFGLNSRSNPTAVVSAKKVTPKSTKNPPLKIKLKLGPIFKRHEQRIKKQRAKRLKQLKAERFLNQIRVVRKSPQFFQIGEAFTLPVPEKLKLKSRVPARREPILKPQSARAMKESIDQYSLKECFVKLTRCDAKPLELETIIEVEQPTMASQEKALETEIHVKEEVLSEILEEHEPIEKSVSRLSFTIISNELTMVCLLCSFEHHEPAEFKKHLKSNHAKYRWYGNCNACGISDYSKALKNVAEFDHMLKLHILKEPVQIRKKVEPKPKKPSQPKPMVSIPRALLPPEVVKNALPVIFPAAQKATPIVANTTKRRLQPWLEATPLKEHKLEDACEKMLNLHCLSALFKCMAIGCSFYTNDIGVFEKHLRLHLLFKPRGEEASFMSCPYCVFKGKSDTDLSRHINDNHGAAKYSCSYCFYRSYGPQVETHQFIYHYEKKPAMIKCIVSHKKDLKNVVEKITKEASNNLAPIPCLICNTKHYSFNIYLKHLKAMHNFTSTKCNNCSETVTMKTIIDHFKTCYKFGNFQCCYCPFGTDSRQQYKVHLVKSHPIDLPLYFDRLNEADKSNPQGLLSIKRIPFIINEQPCQVHMSPRGDDIRNEANVEIMI